MEKNPSTSHTHVIEAATAEEFKAKVLDLARVLGAQTTGTTATAAAPSKEAPKSAPAKKAGTKEKEPEAAPAEEPAAEGGAAADDVDPFDDSPEEAPAAEKPTLEQVKAALQKVVDKKGKGMPKAKEVLAAFGVQKVSTLKEESYPKFIEACNEALK